MNHWKIDRLLELFREAGAIALHLQENPEVGIKSDHTAVTRADREIETLLAAEFDRPAAGSFLIGEESVEERSEAYLRSALAGECFVVDPIDGTAPYAAGVPLWGISIGLLRNGVLEEGAICLPPRDEAFLSCRGTIFHARGVNGSTPSVEPFVPHKAAYTPAAPVCVAQSAARSWEFRFPNQMFVWSACVAVYGALLRGGVYGSIQHCKLWDLAGGLPLLKLAGFEARYGDGRELGCDVVSGGNFQLEPGPGRWRQKGFVVIAPDRQGVETIWNQVNVRNPVQS